MMFALLAIGFDIFLGKDDVFIVHMNHMPNLSQTNELCSYNEERYNVNAFMKNFQQYI
jgi:hypothetical protein